MARTKASGCLDLAGKMGSFGNPDSERTGAIRKMAGKNGCYNCRMDYHQKKSGVISPWTIAVTTNL
jgi:hypothetical protein